MINYFQKVLKGFVPDNGKITLEPMMRVNPEFILIDVDSDDEPEIVFSMEQNNKRKVGILKKEKEVWRLEEVTNSKDHSSAGIYSLLTPLTHMRLTTDSIGEEVTIEQLFEAGMSQFISMIDGKLYYGQVEFSPVPELPDTGQPLEGEQIVIDVDEADVKGDGNTYRVYLLGSANDESDEVSNIVLQVELPATNEIQTIALPLQNGYSPYLFVGDFTGDGIDDILVNFFSAPTGGILYSFIYTLSGDEPILIFDSTSFNKMSKGTVRYLEDYRVRVRPTLMNRNYRIDISDRGRPYLREFYDNNGRLREDPIRGSIEELVAVNPMDYDANKIYNLGIVQPVVGKNPDDLLGLLETFIKWDIDKGQFEPFMQYVSILGKERNNASNTSTINNEELD